ncbi:MAG: type II secretion system F family protein [Planctomycetota bacterium]|jgi:type II secretory pathway component PulF
MAFLFVAGVVGIFFAAVALGGSPGSSTWSLAHFTAYVAATVRRNLPLGSSLSAYARDLPARRFGKRKVLLEIPDAVDNGACFADALDRYPVVFPGWYRALVRAGERGGNLARVLDTLGETAELDSRDTKRLTGQALYPAALAGMAVVMLTMVTGRFTAIVTGMGIPGGAASFGRSVFAGRTLAGVAFLVFAGLFIISLGGMARVRALGHFVTLVLPVGVLLVALSVGVQTYAIFRAVAACNSASRRQSLGIRTPPRTGAGAPPVRNAAP